LNLIATSLDHRAKVNSRIGSKPKRLSTRDALVTMENEAALFV